LKFIYLYILLILNDKFKRKIELKKTINFFKKKNISIFLKCLNPGNNDIFVRYSLFKRNSDYPECCYYNCNYLINIKYIIFI